MPLPAPCPSTSTAVLPARPLTARIAGGLARAGLAWLSSTSGTLAVGDQPVYGNGGRAAPVDDSCCTVVELRQYTLRPGRRDALIELFDRAFVESQEAAGMQVIGQFRDLDAADRFVWLRGFTDMAARARALAAFYDGPVWREHRDAANATMLDSDDVLLLRPAAPASGFVPDGRRDRPGDGGLVVATLYFFDAPVDVDFLDLFARDVVPALHEAGTPVAASYVSESAPNTFPRLPVREGEHVFVWFARYRDEAEYDAFRARLADSPRWRSIAPRLARRLLGPPQVLRLAPTARSRLRGR